jgi:uncharacterized protein YjbJ (UPF0337 family)
MAESRVAAFIRKKLTKEIAMNWDQVKGNWKQFKGQVQQKWGKLTNDDMDLIDGKREELSGKIQAKYGYEKEEAEKQIDSFCDSGCKN